MERNIAEKIVALAFIVIVLIVLAIFIEDSEKTLPHLDYRFDFYIDPDDIEFNNFQMYYNFKTEEGVINFDIYNSNLIGYIRFQLPNNSKVTYLEWRNNTKDDGELYQKNTDYYEELNQPVFKDQNANYITNKKVRDYNTKIVIKFKGKIIPNGNFEFVPGGNRMTPPGGKEDGVFLKFNLGDYVCENIKCIDFFSVIQSKVTLHSFNNTLGIATLKKTAGWEDIDNISFNLNYNKRYTPFYKFIRITSGLIGLLITLVISVLYILETEYFIIKGNKTYHRESCRYIKNKDRIKINDKKIRNGQYKPCKNCIKK